MSVAPSCGAMGRSSVVPWRRSETCQSCGRRGEEVRVVRGRKRGARIDYTVREAIIAKDTGAMGSAALIDS